MNRRRSDLSTTGSSGRRARAARGGELGGDVDYECADRDPCHPVVGGGKEEGQWVPEVDVRHARPQLEQRTRDQGYEADALERVRDRRERRPAEELGIHGPQLGEQKWDRCDTRDDVYSLRHPVETSRRCGQGEPRRRMLGEVRIQTGEEADGERNTEHDPEGRRSAIAVARIVVSGRVPSRENIHGEPTRSLSSCSSTIRWPRPRSNAACWPWSRPSVTAAGSKRSGRTQTSSSQT